MGKAGAFSICRALAVVNALALMAGMVLYRSGCARPADGRRLQVPAAERYRPPGSVSAAPLPRLPSSIRDYFDQGVAEELAGERSLLMPGSKDGFRIPRTRLPMRLEWPTWPEKEEAARKPSPTAPMHVELIPRSWMPLRLTWPKWMEIDAQSREVRRAQPLQIEFYDSFDFAPRIPRAPRLSDIPPRKIIMSGSKSRALDLPDYEAVPPLSLSPPPRRILMHSSKSGTIDLRDEEKTAQSLLYDVIQYRIRRVKREVLDP